MLDYIKYQKFRNKNERKRHLRTLIRDERYLEAINKDLESEHQMKGIYLSQEKSISILTIEGS